MSPRPPATPWTALDRALPRLPDRPPEGLAVAATLDCGADGLVGVCRWGDDGWMLVRVPLDGPDLTQPLTPLMSGAQIGEIAEDVFRGDQRLRTWPLLTNVLALGVLIAAIPPGGAGADADADAPRPKGPELTEAAA